MLLEKILCVYLSPKPHPQALPVTSPQTLAHLTPTMVTVAAVYYKLLSIANNIWHLQHHIVWKKTFFPPQTSPIPYLKPYQYPVPNIVIASTVINLSEY